LGRIVNAAENGSFEYPLQCNDLDQAGIWQIIASWDGTSCLDPAVSEATILTVAKASCEVALDATYNAIKREHSITITGKVIPQFNCVENMFNIPVNLRIVDPESKTIEFTVFTSDKFGAFKEKDYTGFDELGTWTVQADVTNNAYKSAYSDLLKIQVVEEAGYAIIIQGKAAGGEGLLSHNKTANNVYRNLKQRGLMDSDILYINYDDDHQSFRITEQSLIDLSENDLPENITNQLKSILNVNFLTTKEFLDKLETIDSEIMAYSSTILEHCVDQIEVDGITQKDRIQKAITQDLPELMNGKQANIYMVLVDHGSPNKFHVYQDDDNSLETDHFITDVELNQWLNDFETNWKSQYGEKWNQEIVIILGFCFSGSFIDALSTPDSNRIIISSSGPDEFSYKGALEPDNIREGEFFVAEFFKSIAAGRSIKHSFSEAVIQTEIFTANADLSANSTEYFDNARQHPLLDDNGDGIGTNDIYESTGDGRKARDITIGVSPMSTNEYGDVAITQVAPTKFLAYTETSTDQIWAKVVESSKFLILWYEVKPPDFESLLVAEAQMEMQLTRYTTEYDEISDSYK
jgi:hypothetical protein